MQAALRDRYGSPDVVRIEEVPTPSPSGDQVLVRVRAASVNRADLDNLYPRWRFLRLLLGIRAPRERRLGIDVAGVVEACGPGVTRFQPDDRVFADLFEHGTGAFAEYVCAPERAFLRIPDGVTFEDAATLPHSAVLALQGLRRGRRRVVAGEHVLVLGASGNVGPFAVQIARAAGARVTGTARTAKLDFIRSLGVDDAIDYTTTDALAGADTYDWILDVDGNATLRKARHALRPGGIYQTLGGSGTVILSSLIAGPLLSLRSGGRTVGLMLGWKAFDPEDVQTLLQMVAEGTLQPRIDARYPLGEAADALRHLDDGRNRGKVLVIPALDPTGGNDGP